MAACVRSRLNSASSELSFGRLDGHLLRRRARDLLAHLRQPQPALVQDLGGEALLLAQQAEQQMLGADVLVIQPLRFFGAIGQHALALVAQRQIHRGRDLLANRGVRFDLLADGLDRRVRAQEAVRQRLVLPQQTQQQVLGLDVGTAELAGLVPREKDHAPGLLGIAFKHSLSRLLPLQSFRAGILALQVHEGALF